MKTAFDRPDVTSFSVLPPGTRVVSTAGHGASYWTQTARIDTQTADGHERTYFLKVNSSHRIHSLEHIVPQLTELSKVTKNELGRAMMSGEFESATALWTALPSFIPRPIAWGTYQSDPYIHFYVCEFHDMTDEMPDITSFCGNVAQLHLNSIPQNPTGKFGFHTTTYVGNIPQENTWCDSWEKFFSRAFRHHLDLEERVQGYDKEMQDLGIAMIDKVIPRLLRPLEMGGRSIQPCIIHGDLWSGNATMDADTDKPMIFDACAFWGHNECKMC